MRVYIWEYVITSEVAHNSSVSLTLLLRLLVFSVVFFLFFYYRPSCVAAIVHTNEFIYLIELTDTETYLNYVTVHMWFYLRTEVVPTWVQILSQTKHQFFPRCSSITT